MATIRRKALAVAATRQWVVARRVPPPGIIVVTGMAGGGRNALDRMIKLSSPCSDTAISMWAYCKMPSLTCGAMTSLDAAHAAAGDGSSSRPLALRDANTVRVV
ncbi:hypothetical protein MY10362_003322 [Beauveria mimosiformis]